MVPKLFTKFGEEPRGCMGIKLSASSFTNANAVSAAQAVVSAGAGAFNGTHVIGPPELVHLQNSGNLNSTALRALHASGVRSEHHAVRSTMERFSHWTVSNRRMLNRHFSSKLKLIAKSPRRDIARAETLPILLSLNLFLNVGKSYDNSLATNELWRQLQVSFRNIAMLGDDYKDECIGILFTISSAMATRPPLLTRGLDRIHHYFDQYREEGEIWRPIVAKYGIEGLKKCRVISGDRAEAVAVRMLAQSRSVYNLAAVTDPPAAFVDELDRANDYFQSAYMALFGVEAPLDLRQRTYLMKTPIGSHADVIGKRSFLRSGIMHDGLPEARKTIIHEGLHLCFAGHCLYRDLEEGYIDHVIARMQQAFPLPPDYALGKSTYPDDIGIVSRLIGRFPEVQDLLDEMFVRGNPEPLTRFLRANFHGEVRQEARLRLPPGSWMQTFTDLAAIADSK